VVISLICYYILNLYARRSTMDKNNLNFLDAIRIAMEAEGKAAMFYKEAAGKTPNPVGRKLLEQLSDFERHHHSQLQALEESLCDDGACIMYAGRELDFDVPEEVEGIKEADKMSAMGIIDAAIEIKRQAEKRYTALSEETNDPNGQAMFRRLAEEELANRHILQEAYWSVNNRGEWVPSQ
ncbi:MAG: ferritin family protein, partial [Anaerolineae bacterium]